MPPQEVKKKRKRWVTILPSSHFRVPEIGETLTADPSLLVGRTVTVNLMDLTRDPKKQNLKITFKITEIKDNRALTEIKKYQMLPSSIKRMVHQGKSKADSSFILETKDKLKVKIKPVIVTRAKTARSILTKIRKETQDFLAIAVKNQTFSELINSLLNFKIQTQLKQHLRKIYPITVCHIRLLEKQ
jgi:ribosomal protein S3AE